MRHRAKVGVALSGGGVRGLAHLGVLKALEEAGIPVDFIAGTSMGGIVGSLYAAGVPLERAIDFGRKTGIMDLACRDRSRRGLFGQAKLSRLLTDLLGDGKIRFRDLTIPAAVVAADVESGEMVVLDEGPLIPALLATCAFPLVFPPVRYLDRWLVDGGVLNNYPVDVVRRMGADRVLGVLATSSITLPAENEEVRRAASGGSRFPLRRRGWDWRLPFRVAGASVALTSAVVNRARLRYCPPDVHLEVSFSNVGIFAAGRNAELIDAGYEVATQHVPALVALRERPLPPAWVRTLNRAGLRLRRAWNVLQEPACQLLP